ncbi:Zn-ribbon domain-containing OB-fold protein [Euzebya sp.]|uniref:Zn-ribbon domain-containing OB-fold protein n=1 Tax=Euzebya sp. TaxID=1971409 RepID=UPI00351998F6
MTATAEASALTAPFWAAAAEGRLVRPVCDRCGTSFFTPGIACPACQSEAWTYVESSGRGVVYSHSVVHRPPVPGRRTPYVVAIVDLDEGWHLLTNVVGCAPEDVRIGMDVEVRWVTEDGVRLPAFAPRAGERAA